MSQSSKAADRLMEGAWAAILDAFVRFIPLIVVLIIVYVLVKALIKFLGRGK